MRKRKKKVMKRDTKRRKRRKGKDEDCFFLFLVHIGFFPGTNHRSITLLLVRESERNFELDEDDYELLQDNNITGINRPKPVCVVC